MNNYDAKQRIKIEQIILGSYLVDSGPNMKELALKHQLEPRDFYDEKHKFIFKAILNLYKKNFHVDLLSVSQQLLYDKNLKKVGGDYYMIQLTQLIASSSHIETHILMLKQYILQDFWNNFSEEVLQSDWDERDVLTVGDNLIKDFNMLSERIIDPIKNNSRNEEEVLRDKVRKHQLGMATGVPSGIETFDNQVSGWQEPDLTILAARPSMGKTTLAIASTYYSATKGFPGAFFSLEASSYHMKCKPVSAQLGIPFNKIKSGQINEQQLELVLEGIKRISKSGWQVYEDRTIDAIERRCIELHRKGQLKWICIDYLQLVEVSVKKQSREQEVSYISRRLKSLAMKLDVPILALSQLSRSVESRTIKKPNLADLRESGAIEQDADNVIFIYRPAYYRANKSVPIPFEEEWRVELLVEKGRDIGVGAYEIILDIYNYIIR